MQRTKLGDPGFVEGLYDYELDILNDTTVEHIRERIFDQRTQDVSAYNPSGLESRDTYVGDPQRLECR